MSNLVVGNVYQQIIEKVIGASSTDFEEFGVDQSTLDELKQEWQEKLSALKVAAFPWEPQPEPPRQLPTIPSNVKQETEALPSASGSQEQINFPNVPIKSERSYEPPVSSYPPAPVAAGYTGGFNGDIAQQRAHALVAQRLQGQQNLPMSPQQQQGGQMPMMQQQQQQQQRMMAAQQQQQQQQQRPLQVPPQMPQQRQNQAYTAQTDGAGDDLEAWNALKTARAASQEEDRIAADQFMRARVDALAARQDSGLLVPLSQRPRSKRRRTAVRVLQSEKLGEASSSTGPAQLDGDAAQEEEHDSDAINSDLDDPEDDAINGDDSDDETMDYMLCTYDKVQRVKAKWKCTLKDGILTTNKKEYLFHKATGEFEW